MHIVTGAVAPDLAIQYVNAALDPAVQAAMAKPPNDIIPSNRKVALPASVVASVAKTHEELANIRSFDWTKINPQRAELIDRFNREIRL